MAMQKINILYVLTKLELGGAQKQLLSLIARLDKGKFTPFLFTAKNGLLKEEALSIPGLTIKLSSFLERPVNPLKDILALFEIYHFIRKNKIIIVHTHSSKAGILGRWAAGFAGAKVIIHTVHGWPFHDYQPGLWRRVCIWLEKITAGLTERIIVASEHDLQKGLKNRIGDKKKYALVRYGINRQDFNSGRNNIKADLGIKPEDKVIGSISCFKPQKSPQDFIVLASLVNKVMPDVKFLLVGDGLLRRGIEDLIWENRLEKNVILAGWRKDIPQIFSAIDIFVLTSLWEGFPVTILEAMASNKPVIVTHTGGVGELVSEGKNGFLVQPKDMRAMSEKIIRLLKDETLCRAMGDNAGKMLDSRFCIEYTVKASQEIYNQCIWRKAGSNVN